ADHQRGGPCEVILRHETPCSSWVFAVEKCQSVIPDQGAPTHSRTPITGVRSVGSPYSRFMLRALSRPWYQLPPRTTGASAVWTERVHSHTLPAMSSAPTGLRP